MSSSHSPAAQELLAGFAAGAANVVVGYPFDTVKVRLQSSPAGTYRGPLHCAAQVVASEGVRRGLFRGLSSPLVGGTAETGVNYLVYSRVLEMLSTLPLLQTVTVGTTMTATSAADPAGRLTPHLQPHALQSLPSTPPPAHAATASTRPPPLAAVGVAGAAAGVALSAILGPTELIKCRLQAAGAAQRYPRGPRDVIRGVLSSEGGPLGLFRGLGATLAREVPGNALFFVAYEALRRRVLGTDGGGVSGGHGSSNTSGGDAASAGAAEAAGGAEGQRHWLQEAAGAIFCGGAAGTIMWAAVLPIDIAKTRLQTARPGERWDVGLRQHWAMLLKEGGFPALYTGLTPTLLRAFPANAAQWLAWELTLRSLRSSGGSAGGVGEQ